MNGKLAVELLFNFSGGRLNTPSGSREKEGLLMDQRRDILVEVGFTYMQKKVVVGIHCDRNQQVFHTRQSDVSSPFSGCNAFFFGNWPFWLRDLLGKACHGVLRDSHKHTYYNIVP